MNTCLVDIADGEYMVDKEQARLSGRAHSVTLERINLRFGLKKDQLKNYRANNYSRRKAR